MQKNKEILFLGSGMMAEAVLDYLVQRPEVRI
jgi:hypothetical protein